ncbi:MAG: ABC transporter substrate-binding protein [Alphaproteobacteria bacterium]|nr:ABC transporter substrate-binding protein [Alphaproteobacteria bacterium]
MAAFLRRITAAMVAMCLLAAGARAEAPPTTLRFIPQADLRSIDPIWTTAYITRNFGYMVFDTLFALDKDLKPQPQMVDRWSVGDDKLTYKFTLRDRLKWHDGQPVRAADCVASIERWGKRDPFGQKLMDAVATITADDDKSFTIALKTPFPLMLNALGKLSSNVPFMMPERLARTDPFQQISEAIGSGPFKFVKEEWVPGNKAVFVKNPDYLPRQEPPSFAAGGKVAKIDRVEWLYIPDAATASAALNTGEADWYEQPPADLVPVFASNPDVVVTTVDPLGNVGVLRFNQFHPPFDNPKMREAVLNLVQQKDYMQAVAGDPKYWKTCFELFICGTPLGTEAGDDELKHAPDITRAKALIADSGYKGEKIVLLDATDQPIVHAQALVTNELLTRAGLNVQLDANDWGTLITRRASKEPVDKGGWNIFHTWTAAPDMLSPALNGPLRGNGAKAWFGWPEDPKLEALIDEWFKAPDLDAQKKLAAAIQVEAYTNEIPYVPTGLFQIPTAYRKNLDGIIIAPVVFLWNVEKK